MKIRSVKESIYLRLLERLWHARACGLLQKRHVWVESRRHHRLSGHLLLVVVCFLEHLVLILANQHKFFVRGHGQLLEPLGNPMVSVLKGTLTLYSKLIALPFWVRSVRFNPNSVHQSASVGWHFIQLLITRVNTPSLKVVKHEFNEYTHLVRGISSLTEFDLWQTLPISKLIVRRL